METIVEFSKDENLRVFATNSNAASGAVGSINSQSVEALLLLAILEKLEEIRCGNIDIEIATESLGKYIHGTS